MAVDRIDPTPNNYKIRNDLGMERLRHSLKKFGLAGTVVLNPTDPKGYLNPATYKGRYILIDGNSRLDDVKEKKRTSVEASLPDRMLSPSEFKEMSAMFDYAKAGVVDEERIEQDLGTSKKFFDDWGMMVPARVLNTIGKAGQAVTEGFDPGTEKEKDKKAKKSILLRDKFIEPPFSVLDSKNGNWQQRKRDWLELGIKSEVGRDAEVFNLGDLSKASKAKIANKTTFNIPIKKYADQDEYYAKENQALNTSVFDPALTELMYTWFCPKKGSILDPFAGGSVRGIVAHYLQYRYWGIDLSRKQIEANRKQGVDILKKKNQPTWYAGDSEELLKKKWEQKFDFVFTCPPYVDLEVYSNDPRDLSTMKYEAFLKKYEAIIKASLSLLKPNRYACIVVSEVRDKKGYYLDFVGDTKKIFIRNGAKLYNDAVLLNMVGSASMRADRQFSAGKKLVRTHQNVLVFYKP